MRILTPAILFIALASCGASDRSAGDNAKGETRVENQTLARLSVTSSAFTDGGAIPQPFTCDGADRSPALSWGEPPAGTKSFALIVDDPDAPSGLFRHWGAYDIPATTRTIAEGQPVGTQAVNGFGKSGYGGPCPPRGHGAHHYHFKLYALDVDRLELPAEANVEQVESAAQKHAIAKGELIGTYERR